MTPSFTESVPISEATTRPSLPYISRAFSKSIRRNSTVSTLHPTAHPHPTPPQQTHEVQNQKIQKLSDDFTTQRLQLQNTTLALRAKDREIENLYYWLNGRGQQTGDLVFRIGELMNFGQEAESELIELEGELDEVKEGLGKAVKEVLRLREVAGGKGRAGSGENEGGDAEVERLEAVVDAARLHMRYQDHHLEDFEAKIERDRQKMLELEKDRHETWRYAQGVDDDLEAAEAENEKLKEEIELLKVKWEVGSEEYLKLRRECDRERKARVRAERRLAKRMLGRRRLIAVDDVAERADMSDGWEDVVDNDECEGAWF
ncbi:hypothetical protein LTR17_022119 [Elasticomyces elasticus]|nr:hypothetical protein LTR17_022119 [Elasticomyces elasticus]